MSSKRKKLNTKLHDKIKEKYHYCFYCGKYLEKNKRTVDHIEPVSKGGKDIEENIVVSCKRCNSNKSDYSLHEFIRLSLEGYFEPEAILKRQQERITSPMVTKIKDEVEFTTKIVNINDVSISVNTVPPNGYSVRARRKHYLETGVFKKTAIAEEVTLKNGRTIYRLRQGYINYLILKELQEKTMELKVYKQKKE